MEQRIAVLGGGVSPEHEISLRSAAEVMRGLVDAGFPVLPVRIARDGLWHVASEALSAHSPALPLHSTAEFQALTSTGHGRPALHACATLPVRAVGCVFPALHGKGGEDGTLQAVLEAAGLPYVGSGPASSAVAMSKWYGQLLFKGAGLPVAPAFLPSRADAGRIDAPNVCLALEARGMKFPCFLKAEWSGSSIGVYRISDLASLQAALQVVQQEDSAWLIEQGIEGIELTCAVLGNAGGPLEALPPVEIRPRAASFFDYDTKYDADACEELCPAPSLDDGRTKELQSLSCQAHDLLGCRGFSRTDAILSEGRFHLLETNTIPGLTRESLFPKAAEAAGLSFPELMRRLVDLALAASETGVLAAHSIPSEGRDPNAMRNEESRKEQEGC